MSRESCFYRSLVIAKEATRSTVNPPRPPVWRDAAVGAGVAVAVVVAHEVGHQLASIALGFEGGTLHYAAGGRGGVHPLAQEIAADPGGTPFLRPA